MYDNFSINFKIKDYRIFPTVLVEWKSVDTRDPIGFVAIRPALDNFVWKCIQVGYFDFINGEWAVESTEPFPMTNGCYSISMNKMHTTSTVDVSRDGSLVSSLKILSSESEISCYAESNLDKRNFGRIENVSLCQNDLNISFENLKEVSTRNSVLVVVASSDYAHYSKSVFAAARLKARWDGDLAIIVEEGTDPKLIKQFKDRGVYVFVKKILFKNLPRKVEKSFLKLNLFSTEFKRWDKLVYVDLDNIISEPIDNLVGIEGFSSIPCPVNIVDKFYPDQNLSGIRNQELLNSFSFTTNLIAFDTSIIKDNVLPDLSEMAEEYGKYTRLADEPLMNLYFNEWKEVPMFYSGACFFYDGVICRHTTKPKPWEKYSAFYEEWKCNYDEFYKINQ